MRKIFSISFPVTAVLILPMLFFGTAQALTYNQIIPTQGGTVLSASTTNNPPVGSVDGMVSGSDQVYGWAYDPDTASQSISVNFYIDKSFESGGQYIGTTVANMPRPDLNQINIPGNHGFQFEIPASYQDGATHSLYAYGIDSQGGPNPQIANSPFQFKLTIAPPPATSGLSIKSNFEGLVAGTDTVKGWAVDTNNPTQSLTVYIFLDQPYSNGGQIIGQITANVSRPDVDSALSVSGNHGFQFTIPLRFEDGNPHTLYAYAINPAGGNNPLLNGSPVAYNLNTELTSLGHGSITAQVNGSPLTVQTGAWLAGAVESITYRGVEYLDDFDHGRQLMSMASFDHFENCYNPNEGGSEDDGNASKSTSVLKAFSASGNTITSTSQMAFWLAPGETDSTCTNNQPGTAQNTTTLSNFILNKQVVLGYHNLPNVLQYTSTFTVPSAHTEGSFFTIVGDTPSSFSEFWTFDTKTLQPSLYTLSGTLVDQGKPTIFTTPDHASALAIYAPNLPDQFGLGYPIGSFNSASTNGHPANEFGCINLLFNFNAGQYTNTCYVVVGTFNEVVSSLGTLVSYFPPSVLPTPTPSPSPAPTPTPSVTPSPTPTLTPTPSPTPIPTPTPTPSIIPTPTPTPTPIPILTPTPTPTPLVNQKPTGSLDGIKTDGTIFGWSEDPDNLSVSNNVDIYIDKNAGAAGASPLVRVQASGFRSDVGNHAFNYTLPINFFDGKSHQVWVWGIDLTDTSGAHNIQLPGSPKTFTFFTPTPTPTPTLNVTPTPIQTPTPTQIPTPTPTIILTPTPRPSVTPTPSTTPTPNLTPTPVINPTPTPSLTPTPNPLLTPTPSSTPIPSTTPTPSPSLTPTPQPTPTPTPAGSTFVSNTLVNDQGTIYVIEGQYKIGFTTMAVFNSLGYNTRNVIVGNTGKYTTASYVLNSPNEQHPWGSWLIAPKSRTVYYFTSPGFIPVPTFGIFSQNGGDSKYVLPMSSGDLSVLGPSTLLPNMTFSDNRIIPNWP